MIVVGFLALFLSCTLPWIVPARGGGKRNLLEPIFPVSLFFILFFGLKPLMIFVGLPDQSLPAVVGGILEQEPDFAGTVLVAAAIAFFALWIGYLQSPGRKLGKLLWKLADRMMGREEKRLRLAGIVTLGTIGSAAVVYLVVFGWIHPALSGTTYETLLAWLPGAIATVASFLWISLIALLILIRSGHGQVRGSVWLRAVSILLLAGFVGIGVGVPFFLTGSRFAVVAMLISSGTVYYYTTTRRRIRIRAAVIGIVALLGGFYFAESYRLGAAPDAGDAAGPGLWAAVRAVANMSQRMIGFEALAVVMALTPDVLPPMMGKTMLGLIYGWVPRFLWHDKPAISPAYYFTTSYLGEPPDTPTSAAMTVLGDLYMNFLWPGLVVGMFVVGVVLRAFAVLAARCYDGDKRALLLYGALMPHLVNMEWSLALWIMGAIKVLVLVLIAGRLVFKKAEWSGKVANSRAVT